MQVARIVDVLESFAPPSMAESWDNVGLLIGAGRGAAERVLLTIDLTEEVLEEAIAARVGLIVSYHPPIFDPLRTLGDRTWKERIVLNAARAGIAVHSPHTALDAAPGGVNDWLAEGMGSGDVRALVATKSVPPSESHKLVTFCPRPAVERIRAALATCGAGRIGDYTLCSFELDGTGTFHGDEGTRPTVGRAGTLERVDEVRLEMVCPEAALGLAVTTLRTFHPYEEPPIEIYALQPRPQRETGAGRRVVLDQAASLPALIERIKQRLGVRQVRVSVGHPARRRYRTIGLCAGAGGTLAARAFDDGCELYLTGEMRHHDILDARERGCTVVLAGHTNTERGYLRVLRKRLRNALPTLDVTISRRDRDPLREA